MRYGNIKIKETEKGYIISNNKLKLVFEFSILKDLFKRNFINNLEFVTEHYSIELFKEKGQEKWTMLVNNRWYHRSIWILEIKVYDDEILKCLKLSNRIVIE